MKNANYIVFDCETGGFSPAKNPITEIALIALDGKTLKEIDRFEMYIKPYDGLFISKQALEVTGLKMSDINAGFSKKDAVKNIIDFTKKNSINNSPQNRSILVGHNTKFDIGFARYIFESCNKDLFGFVSETFECTMKMSKMFNPEAKSLKLGDCCKELGIELSGAHRAINDTVATAELFRRLVLKMRNGGGVEKGEVINTTVKSRLKFQF